MSEWTESTLRAAASWQAFKEGKSLFETGMVIEAKAGQMGWQGTVRVGKRPLKVTVTVKSATNLETRCPCPDNQRNGSVCCHAVATGLAALAGPTAQPTQKAVEKTAEISWLIVFPANWREALSRGKITATLNQTRDPEISPADERLNAWLQKEKVSLRETLVLNLAGPQAAAFLDAIAEHPRIIAGKDRQSIEILQGVRLSLSATENRSDAVELHPETELWTELASSFWQATESSISRLGEGTAPSEILPALRNLAVGKTARIPTADFLGQLGSWQEWVIFPADSWLGALHFVPARASFELALEGSLQHLEAKLTVNYGAERVAPGLGKLADLPRLAADRCEVRDSIGEEKAVARLLAAGFQFQDVAQGAFKLSGESAVLEFLTQTLPGFHADWSVLKGERLGRAEKQIAIISPQIDFIGSGNDWLSFDLSFKTSDGIEISAADVRALLRSGKGSKQLAGGRRLIVPNEVANLIEPVFSDLDLRQENGHFYASERSGEVIKEIRNKFLNHQIKSNSEKKFDTELPVTLRAELRPYQAAGFEWMWDRAKRFGGALLADDMGLGKTIQTIALIERLFADKDRESEAVLVVATASLLGNWKAEFGRFAPGRQVRILHGSGREREQKAIEPGDVVLTSYGTISRDLAYHLRQNYRAVIVDEASLMRNPDTDHAKAIAKLQADCKIALTGTPIENGVKDLWSIFRFIQPGWLGGREDFKERYEKSPDDESSGSALERLKLKISPFILRRTKEQVAPELPSKLIIDEICDLTADQQAVYKELLIEGRKRVDAIADSGNKGAARMQMLTALLRLRQSCCDLALLGNDRLNQLLVTRRSAKLQRLLELLEEAISGGHRVLIFSQFQKQLLEIEKCISERNWASLRLDGQTRNRQQLVDRFQQPDGPPVFLISLKAGGYGLNLTAADTVIHFDPWWNPAAEAQATDRAHRIGQTRPVTVYRLLTRGTVEEKVVRLQAKKRELASAIDDEGSGDATGWSAEELDSLLL